MLQPQVGFHDLVDFILERRDVSGGRRHSRRRGRPGGAGTHHLHELRHGHFELDDDGVRDVLDGADELVVALEEGRVEPVLGFGAAAACGGHGGVSGRGGGHLLQHPVRGRSAGAGLGAAPGPRLVVY